jgi:NAD(P)-dependent dehydrogenase (short-subunit alcohol dehydrogenase family)
LALSDADWHQAFDTNLFAAVRLDRAFLPAMVQQGAGVIIHISSIQRTLPLFDATLAYAAAKAALTTYSKGLSKEVGPKGIRVNTVAPGYTETEAAQGMVHEIAHRTGSSMDGYCSLKLALHARGTGGHAHTIIGLFDALHLRLELDVHTKRPRALHELVHELRLKARQRPSATMG